jgi:hypothetical protein
MAVLPAPHGPFDIIRSHGDAPDRGDLLRNEDGRLYLRSWQASRLAVGVLGLLMPLLLIGGDIAFLSGGPSTRGSLSAYYHSGMRDAFVGILFVVGIFLVTYRISGRRDPDNWLTIIAGVAAVVVATSPTWRDRPGLPLTPWQEYLGEPRLATIHLIAAGVFVVSLALVSLRFGYRDWERSRAGGDRREPTYAHPTVHVAAGIVMLASLLGMGVLAAAGVEQILGYTVLLLVELVATLAFGISWLVKGADLAAEVRAVEKAVTARPLPRQLVG